MCFPELKAKTHKIPVYVLPEPRPEISKSQNLALYVRDDEEDFHHYPEPRPRLLFPKINLVCGYAGIKNFKITNYVSACPSAISVQNQTQKHSLRRKFGADSKTNVLYYMCFLGGVPKYQRKSSHDCLPFSEVENAYLTLMYLIYLIVPLALLLNYTYSKPTDENIMSGCGSSPNSNTALTCEEPVFREMKRNQDRDMIACPSLRNKTVCMNAEAGRLSQVQSSWQLGI
jgi:hypothetical protein